MVQLSGILRLLLSKLHKIKSFIQNYTWNFRTKQHDHTTGRTVTQDGHINITPINIQKWGRKYTVDLFTTIVDFNWGWTIFTFFFAYFGSWTLFAGGWYLILYVHGDLDQINIDRQKNGTWTPCITGISGLTTAFLFSVETQHTTGYGFYQLTEECQDAILLLCIQSIVGVILEGLLVGLVFMKIAGAKNRATTLMFSRNAVITRRDGKLFFMFRVADMRKTHLLEAHVRAYFISYRTTQEGQIVRCGQQEISVHGEGEKNNQVLLFWPTIILHEINEDSPFNKISEINLGMDNRDFEVIVILGGIIESTGITTQARTSYLPGEILLGYTFKNLTELTIKSNAGERFIDYSEFHDTFYTT